MPNRRDGRHARRVRRIGPNGPPLPDEDMSEEMRAALVSTVLSFILEGDSDDPRTLFAYLHTLHAVTAGMLSILGERLAGQHSLSEHKQWLSNRLQGDEFVEGVVNILSETTQVLTTIRVQLGTDIVLPI